MQPQTLQQRIVIFILVPVFFILAGMGWVSFLYARNAIVKQWSETAIAKLQKEAHMIDMRLNRTKSLLMMLKSSYVQNQGYGIQAFIVEQLRKMDGVVDVKYDLIQKTGMDMNHGRMQRVKKNSMHFGRMDSFELSLPRYNARLNSKTVSLSMGFVDRNDRQVGQIEVIISFQDLIDHIHQATWWESDKAFLIDNEGHILISTRQTDDGDEKSTIFGQTDPLEKKTIAALKENAYGTLFGPGHPPEEISGYYHLNEAPWSLVLISPGERVLKTILNFRLYYFVVGFLSIIGVLLFIRMSITGTTRAIKKVSDAAENLANGIFTEPLSVRSKDEVGVLTHNFNKMTQQLKERIELKQAMGLAMEVQQSLLPPTNFTYKNIDISGCSVYCDETGGDFFDIIQFPEDPEQICVAVGDVVGHGIGAALLMATTRALLRSRVMQKGSLAQIMGDVNRLLCLDTRQTGSFVTLFILMVDVKKGNIHWVRAGHEPALVYAPQQEKIMELKGEGLVLGLDENWEYTENFQHDIPKGTAILIGTDGAWDVKNKAGERLGKQKIKKVLQGSALLSSEKIVQSIILETKKFRDGFRQNDDITLLVLKMGGRIS